MKKLKKIILIYTCLFIMLISSTNAYAANLNVNVDFDGTKIEMTSETPEMEWKINNLLPGQSDEVTLIINSIGNKEVKVEFIPEIISESEIAEFLNIKILNNKANEILYEGNYSELKTISAKIPKKETNSFKVMVSLPEENVPEASKLEAGNKEFQGKNYTVKFKITAIGEKKTQPQNTKERNSVEGNTIEENIVEEITTNVINPLKVTKSYVIFIVLGVLVVTLIILIIMFGRFK